MFFSLIFFNGFDMMFLNKKYFKKYFAQIFIIYSSNIGIAKLSSSL